jgi:hypothetical protein
MKVRVTRPHGPTARSGHTLSRFVVSQIEANFVKQFRNRSRGGGIFLTKLV